MARTTLVILLVLLLLSARWIAGFVIEFEWWKEMQQVETWLQMLSYNLIPAALAALVAFAALWVAHARGMKHAGTGLRHYPVYARISTAVLLLVGVFLSAATVDGWTIVRWAGSRGAPGGWTDPVFGNPLSFYFFDLPFYRVLLRFVLGTSLVAALVFWATARFWELRSLPGSTATSKGPWVSTSAACGARSTPVSCARPRRCSSPPGRSPSCSDATTCSLRTTARWSVWTGPRKTSACRLSG